MGCNCCMAQVPKVKSTTKAPSGDVVVLAVVVPVMEVVTEDLVVAEVSVLVTVVAVVVSVQFLNVNHSVCAGRQAVEGGGSLMTRESSRIQYTPS